MLREDHYPGGKAGNGVAERYICDMPPHSVYVELFAGAAAVLRKKRPAARNILVEKDRAVINEWQGNWGATWRASSGGDLTIIHSDAVRWLRSHGRRLPADAVVFADPPYLREVRADTVRPIYRHEFWTPEQHTMLLEALCALSCRVMICGYWSALYDELLGDLADSSWRVWSFPCSTRGGWQAEEYVWCNFPAIVLPHEAVIVEYGRRGTR